MKRKSALTYRRDSEISVTNELHNRTARNKINKYVTEVEFISNISVIEYKLKFCFVTK